MLTEVERHKLELLEDINTDYQSFMKQLNEVIKKAESQQPNKAERRIPSDRLKVLQRRKEMKRGKARTLDYSTVNEQIGTLLSEDV